MNKRYAFQLDTSEKPELSRTQKIYQENKKNNTNIKLVENADQIH